MKTNEAGQRLIKEFEGLSLKAYLCPANVLTIGYGHTGPDVTPGLEITMSDADYLLRKDLEEFENVVENEVLVPLTDNQFAALVSFTYNVGSDALHKSTLLRLLNSGDYVGASGQFIRWDKVNGKPLNGLRRRRIKETELFLEGIL
jgi:lysozyme